MRTAVQVITFGSYAAMYVNQELWDVLDDIHDLEQVMEALRNLDNFEFAMYENESLVIERVPFLFADAIEFGIYDL